MQNSGISSIGIFDSKLRGSNARHGSNYFRVDTGLELSFKLKATTVGQLQQSWIDAEVYHRSENDGIVDRGIGIHSNFNTASRKICNSPDEWLCFAGSVILRSCSRSLTAWG